MQVERSTQKYLKPKKSLGQHFLRSEKALNQIVESVSVDVATHIFEIGPGEGVLTQKLLECGYTVTVIEIDNRSVKILKEKFAQYLTKKKLFILEQDCLEIDYKQELEKGNGAVTNSAQYVLLGNIPYYITGAIFRQAFEQKLLPLEIIFLIQKEVAQRIVANDKKESILSISIKIFTENIRNVKIVDIVKAGSFVPPPKVDSAIIKIGQIKNPFKTTGEYDIFFQILKASFAHKRKLLLTNLKTDLDQELYKKYFQILKKIIVEDNKVELENREKVRAEDVNIETWKKIIKIL